MRYATAAAFRQALDDRLKAEAAKTGLGLARLRKRVAFELFLRRLVREPRRPCLRSVRRRRVRRRDLVDAGRNRDLGPTLLRRDERVRVPALQLPQHIAEKVHAYTRRYGATGRESTRPKGVVDILLIAESERLEVVSLRDALEATFEQREQQPLPSSLPAPPESWREPYRRLATEVAIEPELDKAFAEASALLDPILAGLTAGEWDSRRRTWS
jgi:hypothetical protein